MLKEVSLDAFITGIINDVKEGQGKVRQGAKSPYFLL